MVVMDRIDTAPTAVLERVSLLLDAFQGAASLTLAEATRRSGLPRSSVHRLLDQLVGLGWVSRHGNRYELGMRIFELGTLVLHHNEVRRAAAPFLHELHRASGLSVHLGVLDGADIIYLDRVCGAGASRLPSRIGGRMPAHASAIGKILLSAADPRHVPQKLVALTPRTITQSAELMRELDRARRDQLASEQGESVLGVSCAAVAVLANSGPAAALSVTGSTSSFCAERLAPLLRDTAQRISQRLHQPTPRSSRG